MRHTVTSLIRTATALALILAATAAHATPQLEMPFASEPSVLEATAIPPNCLLDPWTKKYVCVKWPKPKKVAVAA
jgi:hypothetical protein